MILFRIFLAALVVVSFGACASTDAGKPESASTRMGGDVGVRYQSDSTTDIRPGPQQ